MPRSLTLALLVTGAVVPAAVEGIDNDGLAGAGAAREYEPTAGLLGRGCQYL